MEGNWLVPVRANTQLLVGKVAHFQDLVNEPCRGISVVFEVLPMVLGLMTWVRANRTDSQAVRTEVLYSFICINLQEI